MGASRIEQLIEDIYEFVESCKMQPLSSTKVIVPKDELYDLLDELRLRTPDEIKRYQKIIANRDAILADAEVKASTMLAEAQEKTNNLISDHEIMQQAYYQANEIVQQASDEAQKFLDQASYEANEIRAGAFAYTEDMLSKVEGLLKDAYESSRNNYESLIGSLKENLDTVTSNKKEISQQPPQVEEEEESLPEEVAETIQNTEYSEEEFEFEENAFLDNID